MAEISNEIKNAITAKVAELNPGVKDKVIQLKTDEELSKRTDMVLKGLAKMEEMQNSFKKIKPDHTIHDENGGIASQGYSPAKLAERKKAQENINKLEAALTKALAEADYEPLKKQIGGEKEKSEDNG